MIEIPEKLTNFIDEVDFPDKVEVPLETIDLITEYSSDYPSLGRLTNLNGGVLFNPFGGPDVLAQFLIDPNVTDVISHGSNRAGIVDQFPHSFSKRSIEKILFLMNLE